MEEDAWDFYFAEVDGHPSSVFFNDSLAERAPVAGFASVVRIELMMRQPRPDGLSSSDEFDTLAAIDDAIALEMEKPGAIYAGRVTGNSERHLFYFAKDAETAAQAAVNAMSLFPDYKFDVSVQDDPEWAHYLQFLYPTNRIRQTMMNRSVCEALEERGDPMTAAREIDHWAYFGSADMRERFASRVRQLGYAVRDLMEDESGEPSERYGIQFFRANTPEQDEIDEVTLELFDLAQELGGRYDGWECPIEKPSH